MLYVFVTRCNEIISAILLCIAIRRAFYDKSDKCGCRAHLREHIFIIFAKNILQYFTKTTFHDVVIPLALLLAALHSREKESARSLHSACDICKRAFPPSNGRAITARASTARYLTYPSKSVRMNIPGALIVRRSIHFYVGDDADGGAKTGKSKLRQEPAGRPSDQPSDAKWFTVKALIPLSDTLSARQASTTAQPPLESRKKVGISQLFGSFSRDVAVYKRDRMYV